MSYQMFPANDRITGCFYRKRVSGMKNRERQRANRRLRHREELLDKKNSMGAKDLTAYNAVKQIVTNGNASITWR